MKCSLNRANSCKKLSPEKLDVVGIDCLLDMSAAAAAPKFMNGVNLESIIKGLPMF